MSSYHGSRRYTLDEPMPFPDLPMGLRLQALAKVQEEAAKAERLENGDCFRRKYSPCDDLSLFHDLTCKHRVKTQYVEDCGVNCRCPVARSPFICSVCVIEEVRVQMKFENLTMIQDDDTPMEGLETIRMDKIKAIAEKEVARRTAQGFRLTVVVPKLDPKLQFFNDFSEGGESGRLFDAKMEEKFPERPAEPPTQRPTAKSSKPTGKVTMPARKKLPRGGGGKAIIARRLEPGMLPSGRYNSTRVRDPDIENLVREEAMLNARKRYQALVPQEKKDLLRQQKLVDRGQKMKKNEDAELHLKVRMDDVVDRLGDTHVDVPPGDDATKAVREVLEALSLEAKTAKGRARGEERLRR